MQLWYFPFYLIWLFTSQLVVVELRSKYWSANVVSWASLLCSRERNIAECAWRSYLGFGNWWWLSVRMSRSCSRFWWCRWGFGPFPYALLFLCQASLKVKCTSLSAISKMMTCCCAKLILSIIYQEMFRNLGEGYRGTKTNLDKQCPPMVPAPLHWKPSLHTLHSLTHINIFQNTGLFRSCTLNPTGKRLTHLTIPLTVLPLRSASQTLRCPPPVHTQLISHQRPFILNWFTSSPYPSGEILFWFVSWKKRSSVTSLADFRIKMLH